MTRLTDEELADVEQRARGWLPLQGNRDLAINEERMALDVIDLVAELRVTRLSAADVGVLREIHAEIAEFGMAIDDDVDGAPARKRALTVLTRLTKGAP